MVSKGARRLINSWAGRKLRFHKLVPAHNRGRFSRVKQRWHTRPKANRRRVARRCKSF